jgi:hypothetical protein
MEVLEKVLNPAVVWVFIPILAILLWGITGIIRALHSEPEDFEAWKGQLKELLARVEKLEQAQQSAAARGATAPGTLPTGSYHPTP